MVTVLGCGRHGQMLAALLKLDGVDAALLDMNAEIPANENHIVIGVGNVAKIGDSGLSKRQALFNRYCLFIIGVQHKSASILGTCNKSAQILPHVLVNHGAAVERNVILNSGCIVEHDCHIGAHSHIAPGAVLCGAVTIGERTHVGAGSVIRQGVQIGDDVVVGMGSVVTKNIPSGKTWLKGAII